MASSAQTLFSSSTSRTFLPAPAPHSTSWLSQRSSCSLSFSSPHPCLVISLPVSRRCEWPSRLGCLPGMTAGPVPHSSAIHDSNNISSNVLAFVISIIKGIIGVTAKIAGLLASILSKEKSFLEDVEDNIENMADTAEKVVKGVADLARAIEHIADTVADAAEETEKNLNEAEEKAKIIKDELLETLDTLEDSIKPIRDAAIEAIDKAQTTIPEKTDVADVADTPIAKVQVKEDVADTPMDKVHSTTTGDAPISEAADTTVDSVSQTSSFHAHKHLIFAKLFYFICNSCRKHAAALNSFLISKPRVISWSVALAIVFCSIIQVSPLAIYLLGLS